MGNEQAVIEESATSVKTVEAPEVSAVETVESATTRQEEKSLEEKTSKPTEDKGSEPNEESELGDKGKAELVRLRKRAQKAERETEYYRGRAEALAEAGKGEDPKEKVNTVDYVESQFSKQRPKPQIDQFETVSEFHEALTDWKLDFRDWKKEQGTKTQEFKNKLVAQRARGEKKYENFQEITGSMEFENITLAAIASSEVGEDIAYYLASNPKEKDKIDALPPFLQAKEIGRIETGIETGKIKVKTITEVSSAPEPSPRVKSAAPANVEAEYVSDATSTERRIELSQERRRAQK